MWHHSAGSVLSGPTSFLLPIAAALAPTAVDLNAETDSRSSPQLRHSGSVPGESRSVMRRVCRSSGKTVLFF